MGDHERAREAYLAAKSGLESLEREQPQNPYVASALAFAEAGLGNNDLALREAERAMALLPTSQDPVYGPIFEEALADVKAQAGEADRAHRAAAGYALRGFPSEPGDASLRSHVGHTRSHPRFKALVEGPEPRTIYD